MLITSENFKQTGAVQQFGAMLVRVGRLLDGMIIFLTLYVLLELTMTPWNEVYMVVSLAAVLCFEAIASLSEFYRSWRIVRLRYELSKVFVYWLLSCLVVSFGLYIFNAGERVDSTVIRYWFILSFMLIVIFRYVLRLSLRYFRAFGYDRRVACFLGATDMAVGLAQTFENYPWMGIDVKGFYDDRLVPGGRELAMPKDKLAGNIDAMMQAVEKSEVDIVYICLPMAAERRIKKCIDRMTDFTVSIYYCPSFFNFDLLNARWDNVFGQPVVSIIESPLLGYDGLSKRVFDLFLSVLLVPLLIVPMSLIAGGIKLSSPGPVFYKQKRYGLSGREFMMWKFRTMYTCERDDEYVQARKNDSRVTRFGAFLRKTSLDELPQLFNVIKGDMSIVGPRPHPVKLNETHRKLIRRYMLRHKIKPGITGLAQISGFRGETDSLIKMRKRVEHDLYYIKHWSFWLDLKILFKTIFSVLNDENAY